MWLGDAYCCLLMTIHEMSYEGLSERQVEWKSRGRQSPAAVFGAAVMVWERGKFLNFFCCIGAYYCIFPFARKLVNAGERERPASADNKQHVLQTVIDNPGFFGVHY
jgi:hypothetical protein